MLTARILDNEKNELGKILLGPDGLSFQDFADRGIERRLKKHYHKDYTTRTGGQEGTIHYTRLVTLKAGTREHFEAVTTELHFLRWGKRPGLFLIGEIMEGRGSRNEGER